MHGLVTITGRNGQLLTVLAWSSGTRAKQEGTDLATVARALTMEQLERAHTSLVQRTCCHEAGIVQQEIRRRDPGDTRRTLWESLGTFWPQEKETEHVQDIHPVDGPLD